MRIISWRRLREFVLEHPDSEAELTRWYDVTESAGWKHPADVKLAFGHRVDFVKVESGSTVSVFDIMNNRYRLVAAVHFDYQRVFVLRIMTHQEYDRERWKEEL